MKKDLHNDIDHLFRSAIDEHGEEVPEGIWEKIDSQLDKKQVISFQEKYYRIRRLAIALLLLGIISSVYALYVYVGQRQKEADRAAVQTSTKPASINKAVPTGTTKKNEGGPGQNLQQSGDTIAAGQKEQDNETAGLTPESGQPNGNKNRAEKERATTGEVPSNIGKGAEKRGGTILVSTAGATSSFQKNTERLSSLKAGRQDIAAAPRQAPVQQDFAKPGQPKNTTEDKAAVIKPAAPVSSLQTTPFLARPELFRPLSSIPERTDIASTGAAAAAKGKKLRKALVSLTLFASPDFTINRFENDERLAGPGRNREEVEKNEHPSSSFSSGLLVTYNATPNWSIGSGAIFSASTSTIARKTIYAKPDSRGNIRYELNSAAGMSYLTLKTTSGGAGGGSHPDSIEAAGTKSSVKYLEIPLSVQYRLGKGKFTVSPGVGLSANFLTAGKVQTTVSNSAFAIKEESQSAITGLKSSFSGLASVTTAYRISRRISLNFIPGARFGLSAINKDTPVKSYQSRISLAAGLTLHL